MFSFHKPKIFRSLNGCCICKAKSSSSRFTDSKKYETEFERCFLIKNEIRTGEICNACVLLVKRCKKLPKETTKNWSHVVDARQGNKSVSKAKSLSQTNAINSVSSTKSNRSKPQTSSSDANKRAERKVCEKLFNSQIVNENKSNNVASNSLNDETDLKIVQNTSTSSDECDCSNCVFNRELDESESQTNGKSQQKQKQLSKGIRRSKKTLTPKKFCTETTSNSSSGNSSDSNEDEDEEYISDDDKSNKMSKLNKFKDNKMVTRSGQTVHSYSNLDSPRRQLSGEQSIVKSSSKRNKRKFAVKHMQHVESTFLDMNYWKREEVCCGIIFRNKTNDMVLIDSKLFNPCACRKKKTEQEANKTEETNELMNSNSNQMEVELISESVTSIDTNNNLLIQSTPEKTERINIDLNECIKKSDQLNDSINDVPINELVVVNINSSSGISSDSSDISSITEEEEDSNSSSNNLISDHNLIAKNMITNRTFGVL